MSELLGTPAQNLPDANKLTDVCGAPADARLAVSSVVFCNQSDEPATFRLSHAIAAEPDSRKQYLAWDTVVPGNMSYVFRLGITMGPSDVLRALTSNGQISVGVYNVRVGEDA